MSVKRFRSADSNRARSAVSAGGASILSWSSGLILWVSEGQRQKCQPIHACPKVGPSWFRWQATPRKDSLEFSIGPDFSEKESDPNSVALFASTSAYVSDRFFVDR